MFLTHKDDVADHRRFAGHYACERIMHATTAQHVSASSVSLAVAIRSALTMI
jgi:hypothetical protein